MLKRLATVFKGMDPKQVWRLMSEVLYHVTQYTKSDKVDGDLLRMVYNEIPEDIKYKGPIYRGLRVKSGDMVQLLDNQSFRSDDTKDNMSVVSWSWDESVATGFVIGKNNVQGGEAGVVLESHTNEYDIVIQWDSEVHQYFSSQWGDWGSGFWEWLSIYEWDEWKELGYFDWVREIGVKNTGGEKYNLCEGVRKVIVHSKLLGFKHVQDKYYSHMDEESQKKVNFVLERSPGYLYFVCDSQGRLQFSNFTLKDN